MAEDMEQQLVADLARIVVAETSPQELPLFRAHSEAYFKDPASALKRQGGKDEMLGFGMGEAMTLLTPIALAVASEVVKFVLDEVGKSLKKEGADLIGDVIKRLFKRVRAPGEGRSGHDAKAQEAPPVLTPEQMAQIRRLAFDKARQLNVPETQAGLLADAVIGSLAVAGR